MVPVIHIIHSKFLLSFVQHVCAKISSSHIIPVGIMIIFLPLRWKQKLVSVLIVDSWKEIRYLIYVEISETRKIWVMMHPGH